MDRLLRPDRSHRPVASLTALLLLPLTACPGDDGAHDSAETLPPPTLGSGGPTDTDTDGGPRPTTTEDPSATGSDPGTTGAVADCGNAVVEHGEDCESTSPLCVDCQWVPGNDHACIAPRVLVLSFDPGDALDTPSETDSDRLSACLAQDMAEATRFRAYADASSTAFVRYQIVDSIAIPSQAPQDDDGADFGAIYAAQDICGRVEAGQIDEVWMWGSADGGFPEWVTTGPHYTKDWGTGAQICGRQLTTMGFNYGATTTDDITRRGLALHSIGHRVEGMLVWLFEGTEDVGDTNEGWYEQFDGQNHRYKDPSPPLQLTDAHCGNVHFPPNAIDGYAYNTNATVESDCMSWTLDGGGAPEMIDATTWGCPGGGLPCPGDEYMYLTWWMRSLPGNGHPQGNWWRFMYEGDMGSCDALVDEVPAGCSPLGSHGGSEYLVCPAQTWADGLVTCRAIGEGWDMVAVDDAAENAFVAGQANAAGHGQIWLGLNDRFRETAVPTEFSWTQCRDTTYTNFDSQEPNAWDGEDCVELDYARVGSDGIAGHWNDLGCAVTLPVVCERG